MIFNQSGHTFVEIIVSSIIMLIIVGIILDFQSTANVSTGQIYYLKAVNKAKAELERLRIFFELKYDPNNISYEFAHTGTPDKIFLFKYNKLSNNLDFPAITNNAYLKDSSLKNSLIRTLESPSEDYSDQVDYIYKSYKKTFDSFTIDGQDIDYKDKINFAYTLDEINSQITNVSLIVIDDMGCPNDSLDDLLGYIGWWVERINNNSIQITYTLQFWYPGQNWMEFNPEVIVIKTVMTKV